MLNTIISDATLVLPEGARRSTLYLANGLVTEPFPDADAYRLSLADHLIFPGLINAHDHLQLNCIPALPRSELFANSYAWIERLESAFAEPPIAAAKALPRALRHYHGGLKNVLAGTTTVAHHDPWQSAFDDTAFPVTVLRDYGWAHSLGLGVDRPLRQYGPDVRASFLSTPS